MTAKEAREVLERRIAHGGFADWSPDRAASFWALRRDLDAYAAAVERETIDAILGALRSAETGGAPQATGRTDLDLARHEAWLVGVAECRAAEAKAEREALVAEAERETEARVRAEIGHRCRTEEGCPVYDEDDG